MLLMVKMFLFRCICFKNYFCDIDWNLSLFSLFSDLLGGKFDFIYDVGACQAINLEDRVR